MIRLQFVAGAGISSRLISWWGNGYHGFSHVDAILPNGMLLGARSDIIKGIPAGVQIRPPGYEKWLRTAQVTIGRGDADKWEEFLLAQVGKPYDEINIVDLITGQPVPADSGNWICSALQTAALEVAGSLNKVPIPAQQYTPDSLFLVASALS